MATAVITVAAGGLPVTDVTATAPTRGMAVTEAIAAGTVKYGMPVTKVANGIPMTFVAVETGGGGGITAGYPDANTTGVESGITLTAYVGPTIITTPGTLTENKIITIEIGCQAANCTFRNCRIQHDGVHGIEGSLATNLTVEHCDIVGLGAGGVATGILSSGTFTANDISGYALGIQMTGPGTVRDNYVHDLQRGGADPHYDSFAIFGAAANGILVEHNTFIVPAVGGTANVFLKNTFGPITNVTIRNNLMRGGPAYAVHLDGTDVGGAITAVSIVNNVIETGAFGYFAIDTATATGSGNVAYPSGTPIPFP